MIPLRAKLYLAVAAAFLLGVFGVRAKWLKDGEQKVRAQITERRLETIKEAQDVRNEVEALDRDTLRGRATIWVRGNKSKR